MCSGLGVEIGVDMLIYECPNGHGLIVLYVEPNEEESDKEIRCPVCGAVAQIKGDPGPIDIEASW
jgi:hypothetical protein